MQPKKAASDPLSVVIGMLNIKNLLLKLRRAKNFNRVIVQIFLRGHHLNLSGYLWLCYPILLKR